MTRFRLGMIAVAWIVVQAILVADVIYQGISGASSKW